MNYGNRLELCDHLSDVRNNILSNGLAYVLNRTKPSRRRRTNQWKSPGRHRVIDSLNSPSGLWSVLESWIRHVLDRNKDSWRCFNVHLWRPNCLETAGIRRRSDWAWWFSTGEESEIIMLGRIYGVSNFSLEFRWFFHNKRVTRAVIGNIRVKRFRVCMHRIILIIYKIFYLMLRPTHS